jgi:hypothetical protein
VGPVWPLGPDDDRTAVRPLEFVEVLPGVRQGVASELAEALPGTAGEPPLDSIFLAPTAGGEPRWSLWGEPEG